jgi:hypothetical protein
MELEEELKVVGNSLKSLEVSEEKVCGTCNPGSESVALVRNLQLLLPFLQSKTCVQNCGLHRSIL